MIRSFQRTVADWVMRAFGKDALDNQKERNFRFLEESLELVQSLGLSAEDAQKVVAYVYSRPKGEPYQEVGGVTVTLAALCECAGINMSEAGNAEVRRIYSKIAEIQKKQSEKKAVSAL